MLIDWFTVGAQAANFLILVWLLKRFLYKPVLLAIDMREKQIAAQLQDAETKKTEAQKERDDYQHKSEAFEQQRGALLGKATDEAKTERQRLLDVARKDAEALRSKLEEMANNERDSVNREIVTLAQREVFAIARKTLNDLASTSLEERMVDVFIRRLHEMNEEEKGKLAEFLRTSRAQAMVRSAFDLQSSQRAAIEAAVKETLAAETRPQFRTTPDLVSGIELAVNGHKVAWSIADYLSSLAKSVVTLLEPKSEPAPLPNEGSQNAAG